VTGDPFNRVALWDMDSYSLIQDLYWMTSGVTALAISADGHTIAGGGPDSVIRLWDISILTAEVSERNVSEEHPPSRTGCVCSTVDICCDGCSWIGDVNFCDEFTPSGLDTQRWCQSSPAGVTVDENGLLLESQCDASCTCGACSCGGEDMCSCPDSCVGAEVSSCTEARFGVLKIELAATMGCVDTSFGFEKWIEVGGYSRHFGIVVTHGTLGILNHGVCSDVPQETEAYIPLADPEKLCQGAATFELEWTAGKVTLRIDGTLEAEYAPGAGQPPIPTVPLPVRFNASNDRPDSLQVTKVEWNP